MIAEPQHLNKVKIAYDRYRQLVRHRRSNLPNITASAPSDLAEFCSCLSDATTLYRTTANEAIRLANTSFGPKRFFIESMWNMLDGLIGRIQATNPSHSLIAEHARLLEARKQSGSTATERTPQQQQPQESPTRPQTPPESHQHEHAEQTCEDNNDEEPDEIMEGVTEQKTLEGNNPATKATTNNQQ